MDVPDETVERRELLSVRPRLDLGGHRALVGEVALADLGELHELLRGARPEDRQGVEQEIVGRRPRLQGLPGHVEHLERESAGVRLAVVVQLTRLGSQAHDDVVGRAGGGEQTLRELGRQVVVHGQRATQEAVALGVGGAVAVPVEVEIARNRAGGRGRLATVAPDRAASRIPSLSASARRGPRRGRPRRGHTIRSGPPKRTQSSGSWATQTSASSSSARARTRCRDEVLHAGDLGRLGIVHRCPLPAARSPVALAEQEPGPREQAQTTGVVEMGVGHYDVGDLRGGEARPHRHLRALTTRTGRVEPPDGRADPR